MDKAKLFRIALTVADMTLRDWAAAQKPPVSENTVYKLLDGKLVSARLTESMDGFIQDNLEHLRAAIAA